MVGTGGVHGMVTFLVLASVASPLCPSTGTTIAYSFLIILSRSLCYSGMSTTELHSVIG